MANTTKTSNTEPVPQPPKFCVDCKSPIHPDAKLCPHCQSRQSPHVWANLAKFLKWVAGITAVFTLLITLIRVNEMYQNFKRHHKAINRLVSAGNLQRESGNYSGAWDSYEEALKLDLGHLNAQEEQIDLAMEWLRHIRKADDKTKLAQLITPVLYRGAALARGTRQADIFAHLGFASYLRYLENNAFSQQVEWYYDRALMVEPHNTYANAFRGQFMLDHRNLEEARQCFDRAFETGRDPYYTHFSQVYGVSGRMISKFSRSKVLSVSRCSWSDSKNAWHCDLNSANVL